MKIPTDKEIEDTIIWLEKEWKAVRTLIFKHVKDIDIAKEIIKKCDAISSTERTLDNIIVAKDFLKFGRPLMNPFLHHSPQDMMEDIELRNQSLKEEAQKKS